MEIWKADREKSHDGGGKQALYVGVQPWQAGVSWAWRFISSRKAVALAQRLDKSQAVLPLPVRS